VTDETDAVLAAAAAGARHKLTLNFVFRVQARRVLVGRPSLGRDGDHGVRAVVLQTRKIVGGVEQVEAVDFYARAHLVAPVSSVEPQSCAVVSAYTAYSTLASSGCMVPRL